VDERASRATLDDGFGFGFIPFDNVGMSSINDVIHIIEFRSKEITASHHSSSRGSIHHERALRLQVLVPPNSQDQANCNNYDNTTHTHTLSTMTHIYCKYNIWGYGSLRSAFAPDGGDIQYSYILYKNSVVRSYSTHFSKSSFIASWKSWKLHTITPPQSTHRGMAHTHTHTDRRRPDRSIIADLIEHRRHRRSSIP